MKASEVAYKDLKDRIRKYILWHMNRSFRIALSTSAEYWAKKCSDRFEYTIDECLYWIRRFDWKTDGISYSETNKTLSKVY